MKIALVFSVFLSVSAVFGQAPAATAPAAATPADQSAKGVASEWDASKMIDALTVQEQHLKPILDQVQPDGWLSKGAPQAYVSQWSAAEAQLKYLIASSDALSREPERLPLGLDVYFRMESISSTLGSLAEGVQRYQNPALASLMQSAVSENSNNRDRLRQYLQDLAAQKEEEFQVADREAQRCRAALNQQPARQTKKAIHP